MQDAWRWQLRLRLRSRCGCADGLPLRAGRLQLFGPDIVTFLFCEVLLVLSCLGQAADVLAWIHHKELGDGGSTLKAPLKLEQVPQWGSA